MSIDTFMTLLIALTFGALSLVISLLSILVVDYINKKAIDIKLPLSYAAGIFIGLIFLDLLPEVFEDGDPQLTLYILSGFIFFSLIELVMGYHEHHHIHNVEIGYMDLLSDLIHNFLDGLFIIYSFKLGTLQGILVGIGVVLHEIPQEVSDYIILRYSGFSRAKAILFNLLASSTTIIAIIIGYIVSIEPILLVSFMMGNFIYLAAVDLIPEVSRNVHGIHRLKNYMMFIMGLATMLILEYLLSPILS